jgi:hypothetical protein
MVDLMRKQLRRRVAVLCSNQPIVQKSPLQLDSSLLPVCYVIPIAPMDMTDPG